MLKTVVEAARFELDDLLGRGYAFTHQPLGQHVDPAGLRGYYCDFRHKTHAGVRGGAIPRAQEALGHWERMLHGQDEHRARFLDVADEFERSAQSVPGGGVGWASAIDVPKYGLSRTRPWLSAMAQGEVISVLLRAHDLTGWRRYLELARAAVAPMAVPVADGGLTHRIDGALVLEEYPTPAPTAVLNGSTFALLGLHELVVTDGHPPAVALLDEALAGFHALLPRYDTGWWSLYSLDVHPEPDLAKPFYQRLHPVMLRALDVARPDPALRLMAARWEAQLTGPALARMSQNKLRYRVRRERARR